MQYNASNKKKKAEVVLDLNDKISIFENQYNGRFAQQYENQWSEIKKGHVTFRCLMSNLK